MTTLPWNAEKVLQKLEGVSDPAFRAQYKRFGIDAPRALGVRTPQLNSIAKEIGRSELLALDLWRSDVHEMKHLAIRIMPPKALTEALLWQWASDIYSWDICDGCCLHLFRKAPLAHEWSLRLAKDERLFIRRVGLVLMTAITIHNKQIAASQIATYRAEALRWSGDDRPLIMKAVSWLLRQMGKTRLEYHAHVVDMAQDLSISKVKSARWIGKDVLRELQDDRILKRLEQ